MDPELIERLDRLNDIIIELSKKTERFSIDLHRISHKLGAIPDELGYIYDKDGRIVYYDKHNNHT